MTKTINIKKEGGVVLHWDYIVEMLESIFKTLPNGNYTLSPKKRIKRRSLDQNEWLWMVLTCLEKSSETGSSKEDFHDYYCTKFLRRRIEVNGKETTVISGTSKLNTEKFNEFMEKIYADVATEYGMSLPHPTDLRWEAFKNEYEGFI